MVYLFLADGFEETEALAPLDILRRADVEIKTIGVTGEYVTGSHGVCVKADIDPNSAKKLLNNTDNIEMIIFPGGMPGATHLNESALVHAFIDAALKNEAYIAAICAAPMIIGQRGLLGNKNAVCYPGFEKYLKGAHIHNSAVARDGKYITARAMGCSIEFGLELASAMKGENVAEKIRAGIIA